MISLLKPYRDYVDPSVLWAGVIPNTWAVRRGKSLFAESHIPVREGDEIVTCFRDGQVTLRRNRRTDGFTVAFYEAGYQGVRQGQLVIHAMDAFAGAIGVSDSDGKCTPEYIVAKPRSSEASPDYFAMLLRVAAQQGFILAACPAVRERAPRFRYPHFGAMALLVPPIDEQQAIVKVCRWANSRFERAIASKRKVIALLNEQKRSVIDRAVTGGLNCAGPLKESGNPWLGLIPKHWAHQALWTICKVRSERNPGGLPLLSVFLDRGVIRYEEGGGQVHAPSEDLRNYQVVCPGDFVLNNQQAWRGSVGVSAHHGIISPAYIVLRLSPLLDSQFANFLLRSRAMVDQFVAASKGVGDIQRQVFWPFLRTVQVPLPRIDEQKQIAASLDQATSGANRGIVHLEREILLLRECRLRLAADLVTGKLDARPVASLLPETVESDELVIPAALQDQVLEDAGGTYE